MHLIKVLFLIRAKSRSIQHTIFLSTRQVSKTLLSQPRNIKEEGRTEHMQICKLLFVFCCCVYGTQRGVRKRTDSSEEREECMAVMENRWEPKDGQEVEEDYSHIDTAELFNCLMTGRPLPPPPPKMPDDTNVCSWLCYLVKYSFWYIACALERALR